MDESKLRSIEERVANRIQYKNRLMEQAAEEKIRSIVRDELEKSRWTDNTQSSTPTNNTQPLNQPQLSESTGSSALLVPLVQEKLQSLRRHVGYLEKGVDTLCSQHLLDGRQDEYQRRQVIALLQSISSLSMAVQSLIDTQVNPSSTQDLHDGEDETNTGTR
jgi:hypothetical protein